MRNFIVAFAVVLVGSELSGCGGSDETDLGEVPDGGGGAMAGTAGSGVGGSVTTGGQGGAAAVSGGAGVDAAAGAANPDSGTAGAAATCEGVGSCIPGKTACPAGSVESALACANKNQKCCIVEDAGAPDALACPSVKQPCTTSSECCVGYECATGQHEGLRCCIQPFTQPCATTEQCCFGACLAGICWFDA